MPKRKRSTTASEHPPVDGLREWGLRVWLVMALALGLGTIASARPQNEPPTPAGNAPPLKEPGASERPGGPPPAAGAARGESAGATPLARPEGGLEPRPVEQPPEIFYLPDDGGRLVPVPGFQYRDFLELLGQRERLPGVPRPPGLVIERLVADARPGMGIDADTCTIEITLEVRQTRDGWVDVPLRLAGLILTSDPRVEGPGRFILEGPGRDAAASGYRGWVSGSRDDRHTVTLVGVVALETLADRESFLLDLPVATTSRCVILSARSEPVVTVQPAGLPPRVEPDGAAGSRVVCDGVGGETRFRIAGRGAAAARAGVLPQVAVESLVRIDGRVAVIEAAVRIDGLPADQGAVRLTLPPRCTLVRVGEPASLVRAVGEAVDGTDGARVVEVQVARNPDGVALVELECERPVDPTGRVPFDPLGFAVEGIPGWRQRGRTALVVAGEWQLDWDDPGANRRVDPAPAARQPGFVAAFAHDAQPAALPMRVRPRSSRVVVEPEYRYTIGETRVVLEAKFRVSVRGAPVTRLSVGLDGWTIDEVSPATLVDTAAVASRDGEVVIPFLQPLAGDAVVDLRAALTVDAASDRLSWMMPQPRADLVGPATVTVAADADIEVLPDGEKIRGLVRQVVPASRRSEGDRGQLVYRLDGAAGEFQASRRSLPRRVEAVVDARATVGEEETVVEETLRLDVAHLPLESIDVVLPAAIAEGGTFEIRQGAQRLSPFALPSGDAASAGPEGTALRSLLAVPLLGEGEIVLRWTLPTPRPAGEAEVSPLPLVLPRGARIGRQSFTLLSDENPVVDVRGDVWRRDAAPNLPTAERTWVATRIQESVPLTFSSQPGNGSGDTVVEAAWLETRILADRREDRFRYAVTTTGRRLVLALPPSCLPMRNGLPDAAAVEVRLDGQPIVGAVRPDGAVTIDIPRGPGQGVGRASAQVTIGMSRPRSVAEGGGARWFLGGVLGPLVLEAPRFAEGTLERRFFWDLLLDDNEHLLAAPVHWTSQQRWEWGTLGLERMPVVARGVLADWVAGAVRGVAQRSTGADPTLGGDPLRPTAPAEPPMVSGRVVFAGTGSPGAGTVWLLPTWLLVLLVSGPLLALGLTMVYRPAWRRVPAVFALALPATLAAVAFPDIAPLVVQAAIPGCLLSFLAAGLRRVTEPVVPMVAVAPAADDHDDSTRLVSPPSLIVNLDPPSVVRPASPGRSLP